MRKTHFFITALLMCISVSLSAQSVYVIHGTVPNNISNSAKVTLYENSYRNPQGSKKLNESRIENGRFLFQGEIDQPVMANLRVAGMGTNFILEPGEIFIDFQDEFDITVSGTPLNNDFFQKVTSLWLQTRREMTLLDKNRKEEKEAQTWTQEKEIAYMKASNNTPMLQWSNNQKVFMEKHMDYPGIVSDYITTFVQDTVLQKKYLSRMPENYVANMKPEIEERNARMAAAIQRFQENPKFLPENIPDNVIVGQKFVDITGKTPTGDEEKLSELLKGNKLTVLNFWASWCGSCLAEIPFMNTIQEEFGNRGVQILGISTDQSESAWKKAMEKHKMPWPHILSNEAGITYYVLSIPYTILIDENGIIVARKLQGSQLRNKIIELLGE